MGMTSVWFFDETTRFIGTVDRGAVGAEMGFSQDQESTTTRYNTHTYGSTHERV